MQNIIRPVLAALLSTTISLCAVMAVSRCGQAMPLTYDGYLGDAVIGNGGSRTDGSDLGFIYPVTTVIVATPGPDIADWVFADLPFNVPVQGFGSFVLDRQTPFSFNFTFPPNNYQLSAAHLVMDTNRDTSDTEGIFVDGVLTGRPPVSMVNTTSPKLLHSHYQGSGNPVNNYYMQFSLEHYLQNTRNTFDLDVAELLVQSPLTIFDVISDGFVPVVTADDSPVYQAFLVLNGYTISKNPLTCSTAGPYTFENVYLHNDGNSIGTPSFSGTVETPFQSVSSGVGGFKSIEFFYDPKLPRVPIGDINLATGRLAATVRRNTAEAAIVVNGVGVSTAGFDRTQATVEVERWEDGTTATAYWNTLLGTIPTTEANTAVSIDLNAMLGANTVKTLLAQGKLNVAFGGGIRAVIAGNNTSARTFGTAVSGPTLVMNGTYTNRVCQIPNNPDSPLQGGGVLPPDPDDTTSPQVISSQATEITSTSATIVWLTDEGATTQVDYGIGDTDQQSANDVTLKTFHKVTLTGLLPYKYYYYRVRTADGNDNLTVTNIKVFRTLR